MASFILLDDQTVSATLSFTDDAGQPTVAPTGVTPAWSSVDPDGTITVVASADGLSAVITATGTLTTTTDAQVTVTVGSITGSVSIHVNASAAATVSIALGTPAHK